MNFFVLASVSYLFGVLWGYYTAYYSPILLFITFLVILVSGIFLALHKSFLQQMRQFLFITFLCSLFFGLGSLLIRINITQIDELPSHHLTNYLTNSNFTKSPITIIGRLIKPPEYFCRKARFHLEVQKIILPEQNFMTSGNIRLDWYKPKEGCRYYDTVRVKAKLNLPHDYHNPGCFSYSNHLRQNGIYATGYIKEFYSYIPAKKIPYFKQILRRIYQFRRNISKGIEKATVIPETHLLQAILLGERQKLSKQIKNTFNEAGVAHLLAISGLHLTIFAAAIFFCLRLLFRVLPDKWFETLTLFSKPTYLAALLSIPCIVFYTILTGNRISTVRASIMIVAYFFSFFFENEKKLWHSLLLAAFCILLWQPRALFMADFQLTFLATAGILFVLKYLPNQPLAATQGNLNKFFLHSKEYLLSSFRISLTALSTSRRAAYPASGSRPGMTSFVFLVLRKHFYP